MDSCALTAHYDPGIRVVGEDLIRDGVCVVTGRAVRRILHQLLLILTTKMQW